jgi:hypothetical protein
MTDEVDEMSAASRGSVAHRTYLKTNGKRRITNMSGEWIPVAERLPPDRTVVLAWSGKRVAFGYISDGNWIDTLYGWVIPNGPTHWMPLPAPPTDGTQTGRK